MDGSIVNSQTSGGVAFSGCESCKLAQKSGVCTKPFFFLQGQNNHTHTYKIIKQHWWVIRICDSLCLISSIQT